MSKLTIQDVADTPENMAQVIIDLADRNALQEGRIELQEERNRLLEKVLEAATVISASIHSSGDPYPVGINDLDAAIAAVREGK